MKSEKEKIITFLTKSLMGGNIITVIHAELFIENVSMILIVHTIKNSITYTLPIKKFNINNNLTTIYFHHPISRRAMYIDLDISTLDLSMSHIFNFNLPSI